jgi:pheromone shutdown protein TraB
MEETAGAHEELDVEMTELQRLQGGGASASNAEGGTADDAPNEAYYPLSLLAIDVVASIFFWYFMLFAPMPSAVVSWSLLAAFILAMVLYRVWLSHKPLAGDLSAKVPYTCGIADVGGKELLLVATLHISPRAPEDVKSVIEKTTPDVVMIELDDERLDRMRDVEDIPAESRLAPKIEDLQAVRIIEQGQKETISLHAQRACWNAEWAEQAFSGNIVFDEDDPYGLAASSGELDGRISLILRGAPDQNEFAPFALKAHKAAKAGAQAVLVINHEGELPITRVGGGSLKGELRTWLQTCDCGFPPIPLLLLHHDEGTRLRETIKRVGPSGASAEFEVRSDNWPRRTLRRKVCQGVALFGSGIGILYGVIQCLAVEVGGEFLAAEIAAAAKRIPCVCIDVDLDRFWSRLGGAVLPTPRNLGSSLVAWLAFPRIAARLLFPPQENVDVPGGMVLHLMSFPLRTWIAFGLAGACASFVTTNILQFFSAGAEHAAEGAGVVHVEKESDRENNQALLMLAIEMYMMPRIYDAVAASRDMAMYLSIVKNCRRLNARRVVVVAGAGHANGILHLVRTRGL